MNIRFENWFLHSELSDGDFDLFFCDSSNLLSEKFVLSLINDTSFSLLFLGIIILCFYLFGSKILSNIRETDYALESLINSGFLTVT